MLNLHDFFTFFYAIRKTNNYILSSIQHVFTNNFELLSNFMTYTNVYSIKRVKCMFIYLLTSCLPKVLNLSNLTLLLSLIIYSNIERVNEVDGDRVKDGWGRRGVGKRQGGRVMGGRELNNQWVVKDGILGI